MLINKTTDVIKNYAVMFESYVILLINKTGALIVSTSASFESYVILLINKTENRVLVQLDMFESYVILLINKTYKEFVETFSRFESYVILLINKTGIFSLFASFVFESYVILLINKTRNTMYKMSEEEKIVLSTLKKKVMWEDKEDKDSVICTMLLLSQYNKFKEMAEWLANNPNANRDNILDMADTICGI